jgi:hypothetical protein
MIDCAYLPRQGVGWGTLFAMRHMNKSESIGLTYKMRHSKLMHQTLFRVDRPSSNDRYRYILIYWAWADIQNDTMCFCSMTWCQARHPLGIMEMDTSEPIGLIYRMRACTYVPRHGIGWGTMSELRHMDTSEFIEMTYRMRHSKPICTKLRFKWATLLTMMEMDRSESIELPYRRIACVYLPRHVEG